MRIFLGCIAISFLYSCKPKTTKDYVLYHNAKVYTVDAQFSTSEAFVVSDGLFVAVGSTSELQSKYDFKEKIDLGGKFVYPGLYDGHCHFYGLGLNQQVVDLVGTNSVDEIVQRIREFQQERKHDFILGRGWDQNDWENKDFPTSADLDNLFKDIPIVLERVDGHAYWVNSKVLELARITGDTKTSGGTIVMDDMGTPTGILVDGPMGLVDAIVPQPNRASQIQALKDAEKICLSYGLTTVNDAGLNQDVIELVDSLQQVGDLKIRMYAMISNNAANLSYYLAKEPYKTNRLNVRSVKVYADGALGSRGATLKKPYEDMPTHFGVMITPPEQLDALAQRIAKSGYQMNTHAIGDSANVAVLRAYDKAVNKSEDRRWKVEHAQVLDTPDFDYFAKGILPSVQPTHATSDMYWAEERLGSHRIEGAYAYKTLLEKSGKVILGTDFPVEQVNPYLTYYAAVARQDLQGYPEGGFLAHQALSREETLKGMTLWPAYSNFEENERGSIEVGKMADFIVLDKDILQMDIKEIPNLLPQKVFVGGELLVDVN